MISSPQDIPIYSELVPQPRNTDGIEGHLLPRAVPARMRVEDVEAQGTPLAHLAVRAVLIRCVAGHTSPRSERFDGLDSPGAVPQDLRRILRGCRVLALQSPGGLDG